MRVVKWLIGLIILVGILLTLAPYAARWYLLQWFESRDYQAQIKHLGLDFIFGEITLYDVDISDAKGEGFRVFNARFDVDWLPLLKGRLVIDRATIDSAHVDIRQSADGWVLAGFDSSEWSATLPDKATIEVRAASLTNTEVCKDFKARCLRVESVTLSRARIDPRESGWAFLHDGPLIIEKTFLRDRANNTTLFYGGELSAERGSYAAEAIDVKSARLHNIQFVENELGEGIADAPYQTQIGELVFASVKWQRSQHALKLELGPIEATSVRQAIQKNKAGQLLLPARMRSWLDSIRRSAARDDVSFRLDELKVRDGAVAWADHSVMPPAMEKLSAIQLTFGVIDSAAADAPTPFALEGKIGSNGLLKFQGELFPYSLSDRFSVDGIIEGLDMARLAGYTGKLLNQRVNEGIVDVATEAVAANGRLTASTRWQWTDFDIEPARERSPYMPLELAYDLLKKNNNVRFSVDINGDIGSKMVQPEYILATQVRRTLSELARQQVGANGALKRSSTARSQRQLNLEPLHYSTDSRDPSEQSRRRINEIADLLKSKPHLTMTFCPVATALEWAELFNGGQAPAAGVFPSAEQRQRLLDLGGARGRALRSALMDAGAPANQLVICEPRVDMTQFGLSFVSVSL